MDNRLAPPSHSEGSDPWCRWAWLLGRRVGLADDTVSLLHEVAIDSDRDGEVRRTALQAYWMVADVSDAVSLECELFDQNEMTLAVVGLRHPRWWKDEVWLSACDAWRGADPDIDETIARLWSWANRPMGIIRIPREVTERIGLADPDDIGWADAMEVGLDRANDVPDSPFEAFWRRHIMDWADRWLRWEESVWLYQWRLQEEATLTAWTKSVPYPSSWPDSPAIQTLGVPGARPASESLYLTVLGLGYLLGKDQTPALAAAWDGIWSSWSASLNYMTFEILSNVQTTEWHIGGLTGALRDNYAMKRWGLRLE